MTRQQPTETNDDAATCWHILNEAFMRDGQILFPLCRKPTPCPDHKTQPEEYADMCKVECFRHVHICRPCGATVTNGSYCSIACAERMKYAAEMEERMRRDGEQRRYPPPRPPFPRPLMPPRRCQRCGKPIGVGGLRHVCGPSPMRGR